MGQVTRHEVTELVKKCEEKILPKVQPIGMPGIIGVGFDTVKRELDRTTGVPSVLLRNFARVLKHYIDEPRDPKNIHYFNHVIFQVARGVDATKAIKRARTECDPAKAEAEAKKAMKKIVDREELSVGGLALA